MELSRREFVTLASSALSVLASPIVRAQSLRVRREIRSLSSSDVTALGAGIAAMRALPKENFRSWLYQSGVHGALSGEAAGVPDAGTYWSQCIHSGPHFLSWHRWELLFIEEIIRLMADQCQFTLPYWDYIANGFLPDALRLPADAGNVLYDSTRSAALNNGSGGLSGLNAGALNLTDFNSFSNVLYGNPHSAVHGQVGGNMGSVPTAARDPVFYLHHCNIDRYWECWIRKGGGRANPSSPWTEQTFPFRTLTGSRNAVVGDCVRTDNLGYTYDNLPCAPPINPDIFKVIRDLRFLRLRVRPAISIPDPGPLHFAAAFDAFVLDGRPTAVVLPRRALLLLNSVGITETPNAHVAVVLQDVEMTKAARDGGLFFEVYVASSLSALKSGKLDGIEQIGSFSGFDIAEHGDVTGAEHSGSHTLTFELSENAMRTLVSAKGDVALVFVRRGLVDRSGKPLLFDEKTELLRVGILGVR